MKKSLHKRILALVMAIAIILSTGILDSAGWLMAAGDESSEPLVSSETAGESSAASMGQSTTETLNLGDTTEPDTTGQEESTEAEETGESTEGDTTAASSGDTQESSQGEADPEGQENLEPETPESPVIQVTLYAYFSDTEQTTSTSLGQVTFAQDQTAANFSFTMPEYEGYDVTVADSGGFALMDGRYSSTFERPEEGYEVEVWIQCDPAGTGGDDGSGSLEITQQIPWLATYNFYVDGALVSTQSLKSGDAPVEPAAPSKDGHKFTGWTDGSGSPFSAAPVGELTGNVTRDFTASFTEVRYVYFLDTSGRIIAQKEGTPGQTVTADATFDIPADSALTGWYTESSLTNRVTQVTLPTDSTAPIYLYAKVESGHWIVFDSNGGSYIAPKFYLPSQNTSAPADPTYPGYTFGGWNYTFGGKLDENITLTAQWTASTNTKYTVIHWLENANDSEYSFQTSETKTGTTGTQTRATAKSTGSGAYRGFTAQAITQDTIAGDGSTIINVYYTRNVYSVTFYKLTCTRRNHSHGFSCWALDNTRTITAKHGADIMSQWPLVNGSSRWSEERGGNSYQNNIDVMPIGGEDYWQPKDSDDSLREVEYYVSILPGEQAEVTKGGKGFKIHHVDRSYGSTSSSVGDEDRYPINGFTLNQTYSTDEGENYARAQFFYDRNSYNIVFINGGKTESTVSRLYEQSIADVSYIPKHPTGVPAEYIFAGWYANQLLQGEAYNFEGKTMPANNITLYAKWVAPTVNGTAHLTMAGNGGTTSFHVVYGQKIDPSVLPSQESVMPKDGRDYRWLGWAQKVGGILVPFNFDTVIYGDITLYPYYTSADALTVSYNANGGTGAAPTDSRTYALGTYADVLTAAGMTAADENHVFLGWNTAANGSGDHYFPGDKVEINDNVTLYAIWGPKDSQTSIIYDANGGQGGTSRSLANNSIHTVLTDAEAGVSRTGYRFLGWSTAPGEGNTVVYEPDADVFVYNGMAGNTLYAVWKKAEFTVTYAYTGSVPAGAPAAPAAATKTEGSSYTVAANPSLDGYTFSGWTTGSQGVPAGVTGGSSFQMPGNNVAFTGSWAKRSDLSYTVRYLWNGEPIRADYTSEANKTLGDVIPVTAPQIEGFVLKAGQGNVSLTIGADSAKNVVTFHYDAQIALQANSGTRTYNGSDHTIEGFVTTQFTINGKTYTVSGVTASGTGRNPGRYDVNYSDLSQAVVTGKDSGAVVTDHCILTARKGLLEITADASGYVIKVQGNTAAHTYDGTQKSVSGYTVTEIPANLDASKITFNGKAVSGTNAGDYPMGLTEKNFGYSDGNYTGITFEVTDGGLTIDPAAVTVKIQGNTAAFTYDGSEKSVSGYTVESISNELYTEKDFTCSDEAKVTGTAPGAYPMGLEKGDFANTNDNFTVTFQVTDGKLTINKDSAAYVIKVQGNTAAFTYDGSEKSVSGYTVTEIPAGLDESKITFTGSAVTGTDANTYPMGLTAANFGYSDGNYTGITFEVTDGGLTIDPAAVTVKIQGNTATFTYDGSEKSAQGYTVESISSELYTEKDFTCSDEAKVTGTAPNTYPMGLDQSDFANGNDNFAVTFQVTDGKLTITADSAAYVIKVQGNTAAYTYDGSEKSVSGYTVTEIPAGLDAGKITFTGKAVTGTSASTYPMGLTAANFDYSDGNYTGITFEVTDGGLTIDPAPVTVKIQGNTASFTYDGSEKSVSGYTVESISNELYTEKDFTCADDAKVTGTAPNTYPMGLDQSDFANTNDNFTVTFQVTDGKLTITADSAAYVIKVQGNTAAFTYDGSEKSVSGYTVTEIPAGLDESKITFTGKAVTGTSASTYPMGLTESSFAYDDPNYTGITFEVTDGGLTIDPAPVTVVIQGNTASFTYDGSEKTAQGYTVESISNKLYTARDFTCSDEAKVTGTAPGTYPMGLDKGDFANGNDNFTVTFQVTDGKLTINKDDAAYVIKVKGNTAAYTYDGSEKSVSGYTVTEIPAGLDAGKITFTGSAVTGTDANTYPMGLTAASFGYSDGNYTGITFEVTDGGLTIDPAPVTVKIQGNTAAFTYDGSEKSAQGYTVESISSELYTEKDFTCSDEAKVTGIAPGTYPMGLDKSDFANGNGNFAVTFQVTDGKLVISKDATVYVIKVKGNTAAYTYDGSEKSVSGYTVTEIPAGLNAGKITFTGKAVTGTNADTYPMGLTESSFGYDDPNYTGILFQVTDGGLTISPAPVTVKIQGNTAAYTYDGMAKTVSGYTESDDSDLYTARDYRFSGTASITGTAVGSYPMGLSQDDFRNLNSNFTVTFQVADGGLTISADSAAYVIQVQGNTAAYTYDGTAKTASGYTLVSLPEGLKAEAIQVSGASVSGTNAGSYAMGLTADSFRYTDPGFTNVTFQVVSDGQLVIGKAPVTVTVAGDVQTFVYDGTEKKAQGYAISDNSALYDEKAYVSFSGAASVAATDPGSYPMGLEQADFANTNNNFTVTFALTDGQLTITPDNTRYIIRVAGNTATYTYDGTSKTVSGYTVQDNAGLSESFIQVTGDSATGTNAGSYAMGLSAASFTYTDPGYTNVAFLVTDGKLEIEKAPVTVTIDGNTAAYTYDGTAKTVSGYSQSDDSALYDDAASVTFTGTASRTETDPGAYAMGLTEAQFANTDDNFTVTFALTDGRLTINTDDQPYVITVKGNTATDTYDGAAKTVSGYTVVDNGGLSERYIQVTGDSATGTNAGSYAMGLSADSFTYTNTGYTNVTFQLESDGLLTIAKAPVTITTGSASKVFDGGKLSQEDAKAEGFVSGQGVRFSGYASIDVVGSVENSVRYTAKAGTDLNNYQITTSFGTLEILPVTQGYPVNIQGISGSFLYDGQTHQVAGFHPIRSQGAVAGTGVSSDDSGYTLSFTLNGNPFTVTGLNASGQAVDVTTAQVPITGSAVIRNASGADVTSQFAITLTEGSLTITPRKVTITSGDYSKAYDGAAAQQPTALTNPMAQATALGTAAQPLPSQADTTATFTGDGFAPGQGLVLTFTGSQTYIGSSQNLFTTAPAGGLNSDNYIIELVPGTLTVTAPEDLDLMRKTIVSTPQGQDYQLGETIRFQITVTNPYEKETATVTVAEPDQFKLYDTQGNLLENTVTMNLAGTQTLTLYAEHTVTEADLLEGSVTNTVRLSFTLTYDGTPVDEDEEDTVTTDVEDLDPHLTLVKTVENTPANGEKFDLGETIEYQVVVTNDGNLTLTGLEVIDSLKPNSAEESLIVTQLQLEGFDGTLAPGQSVTFRYSYTVTEADLSGVIINQATASANNPTTPEPGQEPGDDTVPTGKDEEENSTETPTADVRHDVAIDKSIVDPQEIYRVEQPITYQIVITNNGNVTERNLLVTDQMTNAYDQAGSFRFTQLGENCQLTGEGVLITELAPETSVTILCEYLVARADEGREIGNTATVTVDTIPEAPTDDAETAQIEDLYNLVVYYLDAADWSIALAPIQTRRLAEGEAYAIASPQVPGYTTNLTLVAGTMPGENTFVYVLYTKLPEEEPPVDPIVDPDPEDPTVPTYDLTPLEDDPTPLANQDLGEHTCCIMHFLIMLVSMILLGCYTSDRKKYQQRIFQLKKQLAQEDPNWNPDEDLKA